MSDQLYYVYVIELSDDVGPRCDPRKPCVYVGQSAVTPEERLQQHLDGYKASRYVRDFGIKLKPRLYRNYGPYPTRAESEAAGPGSISRCSYPGFTPIFVSEPLAITLAQCDLRY